MASGPGFDDSDSTATAVGSRRLLALGAVSGVLFALGLLVTESVGEFALDVDLKPFFLPYLLIALTRFGLPTLAVGVGGAIGEGVLDVFEGYELDDPAGFIGYVVGFIAFGWYLDEVASDPTSSGALLVGAVFGAFVQALFEGAALFVFGSPESVGIVLVSVLGNTATHGLLLGGIPLVFALPRVRLPDALSESE